MRDLAKIRQNNELKENLREEIRLAYKQLTPEQQEEYEWEILNIHYMQEEGLENIMEMFHDLLP